MMNVTDMESFSTFMNSPEEAQRDKGNGAVYKAYIIQDMKGLATSRHQCVQRDKLYLSRRPSCTGVASLLPFSMAVSL